MLVHMSMLMIRVVVITIVMIITETDKQLLRRKSVSPEHLTMLNPGIVKVGKTL